MPMGNRGTARKKRKTLKTNQKYKDKSREGKGQYVRQKRFPKSIA